MYSNFSTMKPARLEASEVMRSSTIWCATFERALSCYRTSTHSQPLTYAIVRYCETQIKLS